MKIAGTYYPEKFIMRSRSFFGAGSGLESEIINRLLLTGESELLAATACGLYELKGEKLLRLFPDVLTGNVLEPIQYPV